MRVVLLAAANSIHTVQWANRLIAHGLDVHVVTIHEPSSELNKAVPVHRLSPGAPVGYVAAYRSARRLLQRLKPDVVNAHYATGYGTLARLTGFKPLLSSVWGADVYDFPRKSPIHRRLLTANVRSATAIGSTSRAMARETRQYSRPDQTIHITPFGVDEQVFKPQSNTPRSSDDRFVIGTVKSLAPQYGIDTLLQSFAILYNERQSGLVKGLPELRLLIVGGGPDEQSLKAEAARLGIADVTEFRGRVPHETVPECLRELDVYVALSRFDAESFGVAIIEAGACEVPVVVSDADGPSEVTINGRTGFVVPRENPVAAANALRKLVLDPELRTRMGRAGRHHVLANYTWGRCVDIMVSVYEKTIFEFRTEQR